MSFETLYKKVSPRLKKIAHYYNGRGRFIDGDDLYQEMCAHLWNNYGSGIPEDVNESYIVKGCEFHLRNYLRKEREGVTLLSLERPIDEDGNALRDLLPDTKETPDVMANRHLTIETIRNNGFSDKEKEVFLLLLEGYTLREIGGRMKISHVMVSKHKKKILKRWDREYGSGRS